MISDTRYADYDYDGLNRLTQRTFTTTRNLINNYSYYDSVLGTVDGVTYQTTKLHTEIVDNTAYRYTYDVSGNITKIEKGERVGTTNTASNFTDYFSYEYDALGQLTRVNSVPEGTTTVYYYDPWGNVYLKYCFPYTEPSDTLMNPYYVTSYGYGTDSDAGWSRILSTVTYRTYDGTVEEAATVDYDAVGNPLSYLGATLTWQNGRQLASYNKGNTSISYTYDSEGLRTSKTVNGAKSEYLYLNGLLSEEIRDGHRIHYSYDSYGRLAAIQYYFEDNQTFALYYVTTNAQGDVLGLYTGAGVQVSSYEYDAWGNVISMTDSTSFGIATINPIRYRGYYFDEETGWYYLQSRYYDPEIGRFINADEYISTGRGVLGCNVYAYCNNCPIMFSDSSGQLLDIAAAFGAAIFGGAAVALTIVFAGIVIYALTEGTSALQLDLDSNISLLPPKAPSEEEKPKFVPIPLPLPDTDSPTSDDAILYYDVELSGRGNGIRIDRRRGGYTFAQAVLRARRGYDLWTETEDDALDLAIAVSGGYEGPEGGMDSGEALHFHLKNRQKEVHCFFGCIYVDFATYC